MSSAGGRPSWQAMVSVGTSIVPPGPCPPPADTPDTSPLVTTLQVRGSLYDFAVSLYEQLTSRLASLNPDAIYRFKTAGVQLPLFPADVRLLGRSRDTSRSYLTELVERAMMTVKERRSGAADSLAPRLVIAAIATLMIRDKLGGTLDENGSLVSTAQTKFPGYFDWIGQLDLPDRILLDEIIARLSSVVNFSSLEPAMVSDVYEEALVSPSQRRAQGTYYTPRSLARQMVEMVPVETLPPENRSILDPACGSGTLLLAGVDRLEQLQPLQMAPLSRHGYLIDHLRGYDQDPFAVEISKLPIAYECPSSR